MVAVLFVELHGSLVNVVDDRGILFPVASCSLLGSCKGGDNVSDYDEEGSNTCGICGQDDCPCPVCHGDPKQYLGGSHGGIDLEDSDGFPTGEIQCRECDEVS